MITTIANEAQDSRWTLPPGAFRILLAYLVVVTHSLPFKLGPAAVFLFFMLSGYWIDVMWHREYAQTAAPWRTFIISRVWRLMPIYLPSLALYMAVLVLTKNPYPTAFSSPFQALHFYLSNLFILGLVQLPPDYRIVYPAWSLDIELQFYIIAPLIIALAASRKSSAYMVAVGAIAAGFAGYYLVYYENLRAFSGIMPMYLIFFLIGLATARYGWKPSARTSNASLLAAAGFCLLIIAFHKTRALFLTGPFYTPINHYSPAANFVLALLLTPYAMATVRVNAQKRGRFYAAVDRHLSNLTYEVYLLHASVLTGGGFLMAGFSLITQKAVLPALYVVILLLCCLVYHFYDQPIDKLRRDYVKRASRAPETALKLQRQTAVRPQ